MSLWQVTWTCAGDEHCNVVSGECRRTALENLFEMKIPNVTFEDDVAKFGRRKTLVDDDGDTISGIIVESVG